MILDVVTIPVRIPADIAISMTVGKSSSVPAVVPMRPSLTATPVAIAVAPLAESPT